MDVDVKPTGIYSPFGSYEPRYRLAPLDTSGRRSYPQTGEDFLKGGLEISDVRDR